MRDEEASYARKKEKEARQKEEKKGAVLGAKERMRHAHIQRRGLRWDEGGDAILAGVGKSAQKKKKGESSSQAGGARKNGGNKAWLHEIGEPDTKSQRNRHLSGKVQKEKRKILAAKIERLPGPPRHQGAQIRGLEAKNDAVAARSVHLVPRRERKKARSPRNSS